MLTNIVIFFRKNKDYTLQYYKKEQNIPKQP